MRRSRKKHGSEGEAELHQGLSQSSRELWSKYHSAESSRMAMPLHPCLSVNVCKLPWEGYDFEHGSFLQRSGSLWLRLNLKELTVGG